MKLINTAEAGKILGVHYSRVRAFIRQGYLKDYKEVVPGELKHHCKVAVMDVREMKKKFTIDTRTVTPKHPIEPENNGNLPLVPSVPQQPVVGSVQFQPAPMKSFGDRLTNIESTLLVQQEMLDVISKQIDMLLKAWT